MKIFTVLILSFVVHVEFVRTKSKPKNSFTITLGECFYDYDSYKCPENFLKVPQTTDDDNRWCCIKFEDNEQKDPHDTALINEKQSTEDSTTAAVNEKNFVTVTENNNEENLSLVPSEANNVAQNFSADKISTHLPDFHPPEYLIAENVDNDASDTVTNEKIDENIESRIDVDESDVDDAGVTESIPSTTVEESQTTTTTTTTVTTKTTQTRRRPKKVNINRSFGANNFGRDNVMKRKSFPRFGGKSVDKNPIPNTATPVITSAKSIDSDGSRSVEHNAENNIPDTNKVKDNFFVKNSKDFIKSAKDNAKEIRDKFGKKKSSNSKLPDTTNNDSLVTNLPNEQQKNNDDDNALSNNVNAANGGNSKSQNIINDNAVQNKTLSNEIITQMNDTSERINQPLSTSNNNRNLDEANGLDDSDSLNSVGNNLNLPKQKQQQLNNEQDNNGSSIKENSSALENQNYANRLVSNDTGKLPSSSSSHVASISNITNNYNPQEHQYNAETFADSITTKSKDEIKNAAPRFGTLERNFEGTKQQKQYSDNETANDLLDDSLNSKNPDIEVDEVENGSLEQENEKTEHGAILNDVQNNDNENLKPASLNKNENKVLYDGQKIPKYDERTNEKIGKNLNSDFDSQNPKPNGDFSLFKMSDKDKNVKFIL